MKTYQITLDEESAALVDRMLEDGPWSNVNEMFMNGVGMLQEEIVAEADMGLDYEEVKRKLQEGQDDVEAGRMVDAEEFFAQLLSSLEEPALAAS